MMSIALDIGEVLKRETCVLDEADATGLADLIVSEIAVISAAPDMLNALEHLVIWADVRGLWDAPEWEEARKAIDKAEGRE